MWRYSLFGFGKRQVCVFVFFVFVFKCYFKWIGLFCVNFSFGFSDVMRFVLVIGFGCFCSKFEVVNNR